MTNATQTPTITAPEATIVSDGFSPCPFCGGTGAHAEVTEVGGSIWGVHCPNGQCPTSGCWVIKEFSADVREALCILRDLPIVENDDPNTLHLASGSYQGPVVDWTFGIIRKVKEIARNALAMGDGA